MDNGLHLASLYSRNWLFIDATTQGKLGRVKILLCGSGLGSYVAELLLRTGIINMTVADGDRVELSNLNRQAYTTTEIGINKAEALCSRLRQINPSANITCLPVFLTAAHLRELIPTVDIVINTIDFDSEAFVECNSLCRTEGKIELLPVNLGFGGALIMGNDISPTFEHYFGTSKRDELKDCILEHLFDSATKEMKALFEEYKTNPKSYDPQLGVASFVNSAMVASTIAKTIMGLPVKTFPNFYMYDLFED
jgi:tRNA A37 threonylcarbamoyladenosine dehydratase